MQSEIEVKFLHVDHDDIRVRLKKLGAECTHPMRLMRRYILDFPDKHLYNEQQAWVRLRDEGDKVTICYKARGQGVYANEIEFSVGSFDVSLKFLEAIGLTTFSYQESKRETWTLNDVEVVLDEWPWLRPYIEVEGPTEESIKEVTKNLGLEWDDSFTGSVNVAYRQDYPKMTNQDTVEEMPEIKFSGEMPDWLKERQ